MPWPSGTYDFEVELAEDETSKASGRDQMKLTLLVFNTKGEQRKVFDYLGADEKSQWKVRHFCAAVGLIAEYESGELDAWDCQGKTGKLNLALRPARGEYGPSNSVRDYYRGRGRRRRNRRRVRRRRVRRSRLAPSRTTQIPF